MNIYESEDKRGKYYQCVGSTKKFYFGRGCNKVGRQKAITKAIYEYQDIRRKKEPWSLILYYDN
jgi:hypothetical protein